MTYEYVVHRCTYDKLSAYLWDMGQRGYRVTTHFVGGRDWVLVSERPAETPAETAARVAAERFQNADGTPRRSL